ncbi:phosphoribosyltransferase [Vulcanimicrobium alpinum]|uniref:Phosphoribosyltransferase n=1 Tax=Vulcanimicrobium alpinum TaxID=3016050 RepID=A0AAN1Y044_UNVUL|nr:phosphoribosyltransferase family protein [Vulcanimicrobium alpinum]BDE07492.1 phosphoribosyltransferase [Vulcanimicrobium alpinum]
MQDGDRDLDEAQPETFVDRRAAGRSLAALMRRFAGRRDVVVLGLPRGGVPVAYEVAAALGAPLDIFTVRKLGVPEQEELAMGAIGSGGAFVLNPDVIDALRIPHGAVVRVAERERKELERRERLYRDHRAFPELAGKTVILVDDGLATGASMLAAISALRQKDPERVVVAVPVAPADTCAMLRTHADDVICRGTPEPFGGVGAWYDDFSQVGDEEVRDLLARASLSRAS